MFKTLRNVIFATVAALGAAQAQVSPPMANDMMINVARGDGTFQARYIDTDKTGALQFMMFGQDPTPGAPVQLRPQKRLLGPNITCSLTTCDVGVVAGAQGPQGPQGVQGADGPAGAPGTTSYAALTGVPTTFAPSMHTHPSAQISDSTAAGRAILTAVDASAIRGLLNVPAVNRVRATTAADGTYTWALPTACAAGVLPVVSLTPENGTPGEVINHKLTGVTNTTVSITLSRAILTLNGLLNLTIPIIQTSPGAQVIHILAVCP